MLPLGKQSDWPTAGRLSHPRLRLFLVINWYVDMPLAAEMVMHESSCWIVYTDSVQAGGEGNVVALSA